MRRICVECTYFIVCSLLTETDQRKSICWYLIVKPTARVLLMVSAVLSCFIIINKRISIQPIEEHRIVSERRDSSLSETGVVMFIAKVLNFLETFVNR